MRNDLIEQKFEENKNLIYFVINRFVKDKENLNILCSKEDLFQVGSIGLFHAIKTYKESNGAFSTYATNVIRNRIYNELRDTADKSSDFSSSIDDEDSNFIENEASLRYNNCKTVEDNLFLSSQKELLYRLSKKYKGIAQKGVIAIQLTTEGYTCKSIAKLLRTDEKTLTAWISRARQKLRKEPEILEFLGRGDLNEY